MSATREALRIAGAVMGSGSMLTNLMEAHRDAGQVEEGLAVAAEALEFVTETGEREVEVEMHRLRADLLLARSRPDEAEAEAGFRRALDIAREQSAKSLELRAATGLAACGC